MSDQEQQYEDHLGCFGDFRSNDTMCNKFCVLSLRCILERDHNQQMEIWEDLHTFEMMAVTLQ